MGCGFCFLEEKNEPKQINGSIFRKTEEKKDGLDVYNYQNYQIFFNSNTFICPLCNDELPEKEVNEIISLKRNGINFFNSLFYPMRNSISEMKIILEKYDKLIEEEEKYLKTLYYKYKCIKTN